MSTLTKREQFAKAALQGLCAAEWTSGLHESDVALYAVRQADAMLAALAKSAPAPEPQPARTAGPNDVPGCEFVRDRFNGEYSYVHPAGDTGERRCDCQCGSFLVGDTWHWHIEGICHNPVRCHGAEGGK